MTVHIIEYDTKSGNKRDLTKLNMTIIPNAHDYIKLSGITYSVISRCFTETSEIELVVYNAD